MGKYENLPLSALPEAVPVTGFDDEKLNAAELLPAEPDPNRPLPDATLEPVAVPYMQLEFQILQIHLTAMPAKTYSYTLTHKYMYKYNYMLLHSTKNTTSRSMTT